MPEKYNQQLNENLEKDLAKQGLIEEETKEVAQGPRKNIADSKIPALQTFKGDVSSYIKERNLSLIDIAAQASKERRFDEKENQISRTIFIAGGIIALIAGLAIAGWLILKKEKTTAEPAEPEIPKSLVFADKREILNLKSEQQKELIGLLQKAAESLIPLNTISYFPVLLETPKEKTMGQTKEKKEFLNVSRLFEILGIKLPPNFLQAVENNFTFGIFYLKKNNPFLVFKIRSFDLALSGALNWEKNMVSDLKEMFSIQNLPPTSQKFQDKIIKNRDARIIYDAGNNPILIYAFFDKKYLFIAVDIDTFEEILQRLTTSR